MLLSDVLLNARGQDVSSCKILGQGRSPVVQHVFFFYKGVRSLTNLLDEDTPDDETTFTQQ